MRIIFFKNLSLNLFLAIESEVPEVQQKQEFSDSAEKEDESSIITRTPKIEHRPKWRLSEMAKFVETPKNMRDPTLPSTVEWQQILNQAVEDSDVERCKRDKIGIYSKSAVKEREKRELEPKTSTPKATNVPKLNFGAKDAKPKLEESYQGSDPIEESIIKVRYSSLCGLQFHSLFRKA